MLKIGLILSSPSPHQEDFLNALAQRSDVDAFIGYVQPINRNRHWGRPTPNLRWENLPSSPRAVLNGSIHRWLSDRPADVWLLSSAYTQLATHAVARSLRRLQQPFAFLAEPPRPTTGGKAFLQRLLVRSIVDRADAVLGTGTESARRYRRITTEHKPVESLPYYVDMARQLATETVACPAAGEPFRFVASAQLIHRKGLDVLIAACEQLPRDGWTLDIFGDGPLRQELQESAVEIGRPITFHGLLPYERKHEAFVGRHCFVFSTRWDGWGMVLPEALAMGLPVISTDQAMSAHDFITPANGQIIPADNASRLAQAMRTAINTQHNLPQQSIAAKEALANYRPELGAERLVTVLSAMAGKAA